jgi:hypothetical protein
MTAYKKRRLVHGEIQHRWPSLSEAVRDSQVRTPEDLAAVLSKQMGFTERRAKMEARGFWSDLEEKFRLAAAS